MGALVTDIGDPSFFDWAMARTGLPADDHPVHGAQVEFAHGADQGFEGEEAHRRVGVTQMLDARFLGAVLDRDAEPDVGGHGRVDITLVDVITHARRAFGEDLEGVPVRCFHGGEHLVHVIEGHALVEQVAHGVDENHARLFPRKRLFETGRSKRQVEPRLERVALHAAKPFREPFRIAVVATRADFRAARDRIPRRVGPFDFGGLRHAITIEENETRTIICGLWISCHGEIQISLTPQRF